jgi:hypothetical protein
MSDGPVAAWNRFWFRPQATSTLAILRIGFGLLVLVWTLSLLGQAGSFFTSDGIVPSQPSETVFNHFQPGAWGLLDIFSGDVALVLVFLALILACLALIAGFGTRIAAIVVFLGVLSLERRNPYVFNSGDYLIRNLAFILMLAPLGASLSVDRWRSARERFWEFPARAPWALRLIQVQVSILYLSTVWAKVQGQHWNDGTAVGYAVRIADHQRLPVPDLLSDSALLTNLLTYGTLATELALGILIWNRAARRYVIPIGIGMHLFIDYSLLVGFFTYAVFVCYLAFIPDDTASRWILAVREWVIRRRVETPRQATKPVSAAMGPDESAAQGK